VIAGPLSPSSHAFGFACLALLGLERVSLRALPGGFGSDVYG
jgi:hypothetical protein